MSKENLEQFIQQISDSEELQARIGDEIDAESLIALGAEHGCEFSAEDLAEHAELSDEELEGVAGGRLDRGEDNGDRGNKLRLYGSGVDGNRMLSFAVLFPDHTHGQMT